MNRNETTRPRRDHERLHTENTQRIRELERELEAGYALNRALKAERAQLRAEARRLRIDAALSVEGWR